jgi:hypothetical protein
MDIDIYDKVKELEREIWKIKVTLLRSGSIKRSKKPISLEGIWKGVEITEEDIERAKKPLFPQDYEV